MKLRRFLRSELTAVLCTCTLTEVNMFEKQSRLEIKLDNIDARIREVNEKYWELLHKHERLLRHLGLSEYKVPETIELRTKEMKYE